MDKLFGTEYNNNNNNNKENSYDIKRIMNYTNQIIDKNENNNYQSISR